MAYITDYTVIQDCDDPTTDWTGTGDMPVQTNQNGSVPQFYIEGIACVATELGAEKQGYHTHTQTFSLTGRALVIYNWLTGPGELSVLEYWTNRVYQGANYVDYDLLPELLTLAQGGWLPYVLWPTPDATQAHITNSGTPTVSGITAVEVRGYNSGTTINIKVMGYDIVGAIGYLGAQAQTVTIDQLSQESKDNYYGVITEKGGTVKSFQVQCMIRYGGSGTTTVSESNKTITFRGANPDHPVGYLFNSGGTATNITWTDMVFNWEFPQPAFTFTGTPTNFKIDGCSFNGFAYTPLPAYSVNRWMKTSKFNACQGINIGDCIFEDNIVSNSASGFPGVVYEGSTDTRRAKRTAYTGNHTAIEFDTVGNYDLDGDQFSGNTYDIENSDNASTITAGSFVVGRAYKILTVGSTDFTLIGSPNNTIGTKFVATGVGIGTGTATEVLLINALNGANPSGAKINNSGTNADTLIQNAVTISIKVQNEAKANIQDAQVSVHLLNSPFTALMNEDTLATGLAEESYNYGGNVDVVVKVRKSETTDSPRYHAYSSTAEITSAGLSLTITLVVNPFI